MKFLVIILLGIALHGNTSDTYAWDSTAAKYMPLQVGNVWVYGTSYSYPFGSGTGYDRYRLSGMQLINGRLFYVIDHTHIQISGTYSCSSRLFSGNYAIRIDSASMNLSKNSVCGSSSEALVDSLASKFKDSSITCPNFLGSKTALNDTSDYYIFNSYFNTKKFATVNINGGYDQTYLEGIGLVRYYYSVSNELCNNYLKGCIINGVIYGDTSMIVGINPISTGIPEYFDLKQNYPNPFNPVTKIKFDISGTSVAQTFLSVYDILGHEVAVLVNQQLQPGSYEADWDATIYPSGVYYYKLEVIDPSTPLRVTETKKMVLIK